MIIVGKTPKGVEMARAEPPEGVTKWTGALYAIPGLVLALLVFALAGYPFAARLLAMIAAMLVGLGAWYLASRSPRRPLFLGLVAAVHLGVVAGLPALALTAYPGWMGAGEYAGLSFWTVPHAVWTGVLFSLFGGIWTAVLGRFRRRAPVDRSDPS